MVGLKELIKFFSRIFYLNRKHCAPCISSKVPCSLGLMKVSTLYGTPRFSESGTPSSGAQSEPTAGKLHLHLPASFQRDWKSPMHPCAQPRPTRGRHSPGQLVPRPQIGWGGQVTELQASGMVARDSSCLTKLGFGPNPSPFPSIPSAAVRRAPHAQATPRTRQSPL